MCKKRRGWEGNSSACCLESWLTVAKLLQMQKLLIAVALQTPGAVAGLVWLQIQDNVPVEREAVEAEVQVSFSAVELPSQCSGKQQKPSRVSE